MLNRLRGGGEGIESAATFGGFARAAGMRARESIRFPLGRPYMRRSSDDTVRSPAGTCSILSFPPPRRFGFSLFRFPRADQSGFRSRTEKIDVRVTSAQLSATTAVSCRRGGSKGETRGGRLERGGSCNVKRYRTGFEGSRRLPCRSRTFALLAGKKIGAGGGAGARTEGHDDEVPT